MDWARPVKVSLQMEQKDDATRGSICEMVRENGVTAAKRRGKATNNRDCDAKTGILSYIL